MRQLPPLNALRSFEAAARRLSFSAAADELCVTHSAISHQIRQLEEWLGHTLFVRHAGGVRPTPAGLQLLQATTQGFSLIEACSTALREAEAVHEIVLGAPGSFLANWLIPRLEHFEASHPGLRIRLQTSSSLDELLKQRVDALITTGTSWPRQIAATPLFAEAIGPVCSPSWQPAILDASDLAALPLLQTSSRPQAWEEWARTQGLDGSHLQAVRSFDHLPLLLEAAAAGMGIAMAPALLVERELAAGRLLAPLGFASSGASFALCVHANSIHDAHLAVIRAWLEEEAT